MTTTLHTLKNGFTLLLEENRSAPVVSFSLLVKVGSAMETEKEAGISHFIEHMLFKGTPTRPVGSIARDVEASGGDINAYTSFDQTVYYINMASRYADTGMEILADISQNPLFDQEEIEREAEVICEEIRRGDDSPSHLLSESLFAHTYEDHPYGRPIIGYVKNVKGFQHKDFVSYWQRWYTPSNMTMVVVGDFDTKEYINKLDKLFGKMPERKTPAKPDVEKVVIPKKVRCFQERANIQSSYFGFSFIIPSINHADIPALDLLSHILGGSESSRLDMQIKESKRLLQSIYTYAYTPRGSGIFLIGGMAKDQQMTKAIPAIWEEVELIRNVAPHAAEVARAKLNIVSSELWERESVGGQGGKYAYMLATAGDHKFEEKYFEAINKTTAEDIRRVAEIYLNPSIATLTWLAPKKAKIITTAQAIKAWDKKTKPAQKIAKKSVSTAAEARPTEIKLKNGIRLIVRPQHRLPLIACYCTVLGGTRYENAKNNGINTLLATLLTKSTAHRDASTLAEDCDAIAGDFGASAGYNSFGMRGEFISEKMSEGFKILGEMLTAPAFDKKELANEKALLLEAIRNRQDNLAATAHMQFCKALFGKHPYALPRVGQKASVRNITVGALQRYYKMLINPKNMVVAISGDIDVETARAMVEKHLHWEEKTSVIKPPKVIKLKPVTPATLTVRHADKQQAHIFYGMRATTVTGSDRYPFTLLNQILAGQGGRLFLTLRDQMSLAYSVSASHQLGIESGFFHVYIGTDPSKVDIAVKGIKDQLANIASQEVTSDELKRAQQYLVGAYELELQRNANVATNHALNVLYGLGLDEAGRYPERILKVTAKDVLRVARKYLREDSAVCSIVRP